MTGTIRPGKGVRREAESEESRRRNRGLDVRKADMRPLQRLGHPARDGNARLSFGTLRGRSDGSARRRQVLPEEISVLVRSHRTTAAAMRRDRGGEVGRGLTRSEEEGSVLSRIRLAMRLCLWSSPTGRRAESLTSRSRRSVSMSAERQKGEQHHGDEGAGGTRSTEHGRQQAFTAFDHQRALTSQF